LFIFIAFSQLKAYDKDEEHTKMRYLINESTYPYFNLAFDEYALLHLNVDDFFFIRRNTPSFINDKHQNVLDEINQIFINIQNNHIARRVSSGGAVYHDYYNLDSTFIINPNISKYIHYKGFTQLMIDALDAMGLNPNLSERNDTSIDGYKISGHAQKVANHKLLYRDALLYNANIEFLTYAMQVPHDKYTTSGVKPVRSKMINHKQHYPYSHDILISLKTLHFFCLTKS
jgi:lipoate---protein ligase